MVKMGNKGYWLTIVSSVGDLVLEMLALSVLLPDRFIQNCMITGRRRPISFASIYLLLGTLWP
jgi:hypothetical protein